MPDVVLWTSAETKTVKKLTDPIKHALPKDVQLGQAPLNTMLVEPGEGSVVLAMGNKAMELLRIHGLVPKGRTMSYLREKPIGWNGGWWLLANDPNYAAIDASVTEIIQWDVQLAARLASTGTTVPTLGKYAYTSTLKFVRQYVEEQYAATGKPVPLALDLETMGLYPYYPNKKILTVAVTPAEGYSDVVKVQELGDQELKDLVEDLSWLLNTPKARFRGANLKFDLTWLKVKYDLECTNFTMDTTIVGSLLNENRSNSLNMHAKIYTTMGGYDDQFNVKFDKAHMEVALAKDPEGFLTYAGGDTDACLRVSNVMIHDLAEDRSLQRFYLKVLHPAARAFEKIEHRGVLVDREKMAEIRKEVAAKITELESQALAMMPRRLRLKHFKSINNPDQSALAKASLLQDFFFTPLGLNLKPKMFTEKTKQPSTNKDHLLMFGDVPEAKAFVDIFQQWSVATKTLSTYIDGFSEHIRPDGRFHPTYFLFAGQGEGDIDGGTNTGRLSAKAPALQTLPKHTVWASRLREAYPAPPGYVFFEIDVDQGELKITACVSGDETMLNVFRAGRDIHAMTGGKLAGYEYDEMMAMKAREAVYGKDDPDFKLFKKLRQRAKAANFGLIYRISVGGYQEYARKSYGVYLSDEEAAKHHTGFFDLYTGLHDWHNDFVQHARNHGWVKSPLGRTRHLPLINSKDSMVRGTSERQAINAPIQSCLSDMVLLAIGILNEQYPDLWIAGMTHDSVYGYVPEDQVDMWVKRIAGTISNLPLKDLGWEPQIGFTASAEVGPNWSKLTAVPV